jgi:hypothetical protein
MKTLTILLGLILMTGLSTTAFAQEEETIHVYVMKKTDGTTLVIDTLFEVNGEFDLNAFIASLGLDLPEMPPLPEGCGSMTDNSTTTTTTDDGKKVICKKIIVSDENVIEGEGGMMVFTDVTGDSITINLEHPDSMQGMFFITADAAMEEGLEGDMVDIRVIRIKVCDLAPEEKKLIQAPDKSELELENLVFYPNPGDGKFSLRFNSESKTPVNIDIMNAEGKKIYSEKVQDFNGSYQKEIDITGAGSGVYFLTIQQGKKQVSRKVILK